MFSVFSDFTIIQWNIFGSIIVLIAISIALLVVVLLEGLGFYPEGIDSGLNGRWWEIEGTAVGCAICSGISILIGIMALMGNLLRIRCLTWGGLITSLVLFLFELGASIYLLMVKDHANWLGNDWNNDINDVVVNYYPTHAAAFNDKYGDACPSTYAESSELACSSAMSQYIENHWHKMGLIGLILTAIAIVVCIFAIVMHCLAKREFTQKDEQHEWDQAAKRYSDSFADTKTPGSESTDLANKV
jgi:hypothetical protein